MQRKDRKTRKKETLGEKKTRKSKKKRIMGEKVIDRMTQTLRGPSRGKNP